MKTTANTIALSRSHPAKPKARQQENQRRPNRLTSDTQIADMGSSPRKSSSEGSITLMQRRRSSPVGSTRDNTPDRLALVLMGPLSRAGIPSKWLFIQLSGNVLL